MNLFELFVILFVSNMAGAIIVLVVKTAWGAIVNGVPETRAEPIHVIEQDKPVEVVEFQPQFDIDVMFDRIVGDPVAEKAMAKAEAKRKRKEMMAPIRQTFDRMIKTRKPMVSGGEPLKISDNRLRIDEFEVSFHIHPGIGVRFVGVEWSQEKSYRVYSFGPMWASLQDSDRTDEYYDNWRDAYKRALECLEPYIASCDGKEAV